MFLVALALLAAEPLTIERAVTLALERNERAKIADATAAAADARLSRARTFFFPRVSASGSYVRRPANFGGGSAQIQNGDGINASATASLTLFEARALPAWRAAAAERDAARLATQRARVAKSRNALRR